MILRTCLIKVHTVAELPFPSSKASTCDSVDNPPRLKREHYSLLRELRRSKHPQKPGASACATFHAAPLSSAVDVSALGLQDKEIEAMLADLTKVGSCLCRDDRK